MGLLKIGGQDYFVDFANIEKVLSSGSGGFKGGMITETTTTTTYNEKGEVTLKTVVAEDRHMSKEVDGFRYETIKTMIEILLLTDEEDNATQSLNNQSISFKLAFNTLIEYGILNIA